MQKYIIYCVASLIIYALILEQSSLIQTRYTEVGNDINRTWEDWKSQYLISFSSTEEENYRFSIFLKTLEIIENHNKQDNPSYFLGLNQFAALSPLEFQELYFTGPPKQLNKQGNMQSSKQLKTQDLSQVPPINVNWVAKGMVMPVANMGSCQASYALTAVSSMYSLYLIQTNFNVVSSSEQIVQCSQQNGNLGCNGGTILNAFNYMTNNLICLASQYPYVSSGGVTGACNTALKGQHQIGGYDYIPGDCNYIMNNLQSTPIAVEIVPGPTLQYYKSGVFLGQDCPGNMNSLAMVLVGVQSGISWILQAPFGILWGQAGYLYLQLGNSCEACYDALQPNL